MVSDKIKGLMYIGLMTGAVGFIMVFGSVSFGNSLAENWLMKRGGADTSYYHIMVESYINTFLVAGGILAGIGLFLAVCLYMKYIKYVQEK